MSIIWIYVMIFIRPAGEVSCVTKTLALDITCELFKQGMTGMLFLLEYRIDNHRRQCFHQKA